MTEQQKRVMLAKLIEFQDGFNPLTNEEAQWVIQKTTVAMAIMVAAIQKAFAEENHLLEFLGTLTISATTTPFVVKKELAIGQSGIKYHGDNFKQWFGGKVEEPQTETTLCSHRLKKWSRDPAIIAELGGEEKAETTLFTIGSLLSQQAKGESGSLLTNGYANIFYVRDVEGVLRAILVRWYGGGWYLGAHAVESPGGWNDGSRVFSGN